MGEKAFLRALSALPTLSPVLRHISQVVEDPKSSASDIAKVLQFDPVIAGKVLRLANSAYVGFQARVSSLQNAVVILGCKRVHSLLLAFQLSMIRRELTPPFSMIKFWRHSVVCALVAESIARHLKRYDTIDEHEVFAGALLHDIGKLVSGIMSPRVMADTNQNAFSQGLPFFMAEDPADSHMKIGEVCAETWSFPSVLKACIGGHHNPQDYPQFGKLIPVIHVADVMTHLLGFTIFDSEVSPSIEDVALTQIQLPLECLKVIAETVIRDQKAVESLMEIME